MLLLPENRFLARGYDPHEDRFMKRRHDPHEDSMSSRLGALMQGHFEFAGGLKPPPPPPPTPDPQCTALFAQLLEFKASLAAVQAAVLGGDLSQLGLLSGLNKSIADTQTNLSECLKGNPPGTLFAMSQNVVLTVGEFLASHGVALTPIKIQFDAIFMTFFPPFHTSFSYFLTGGFLGDPSNFFKFSNASGTGTLDPISGKMTMGAQFNTTFGENILSFFLSTEDHNTDLILMVPEGSRAQTLDNKMSVRLSGPGLSLGGGGPGPQGGLQDFFAEDQLRALL
jgi:hypothetical protein